ncbi:MAG TPA: PAS domain S-box protein [Spirochaetota bacterium]|nr:PAS domain S-box protein [Spirochaetota bacterium]
MDEMSRRSARIAVVEDETIIAADIRNILLKEGYETVAILHSGEEAIEKIPELQPDLVFMDIILGGAIDGIDASLRIREIIDVPIVFLTAHSDHKTLDRAKQAGPYGYILKPVNSNEIISIVETVLYRHNLEKRLRERDEALRASVEKLSKAFAFSPSAISITRMSDGTFIDVNESFLSLYGFSREEIINIRALDAGIWPDASERERFISALLRKGSLRDRDVTITTRNGEKRLSSMSATLIDIGGEKQVLTVLNDITERKTVEQALRESEEKYRLLFSSVSDAIVIFYVNTLEIIDANSSALVLYDYSIDELRGMRITDLSESPDEFCVEIIRQMTESDKNAHPQNHLKKNGVVFPVEVSGGIFTLNQREIGIAMIRDITRRRQLEEELLRTQKFEAIGILAGGIAHDFNNLLTAISGNVALGKMIANPEDELYENLLEIEKAATLAKDLSFQLLHFGRLSKPLIDTVSLEEILRYSAEKLFVPDNVSIAIDIAEGLWPAKIDPGQIQRVIGHILMNAVEAMPTGGEALVIAENITIDAGHQIPVRPGRYIRISISDRGIGIPPENVTRVFDPYFTTKTTYSEKGMGLGLSLSYSIVKRHHGHIVIDSTVNAGTTVVLYLPAAD